MLAIMEPLGSGKSTLLNLIGCMDDLTSGEYTLDGEAVGRMNAKQLARVRNEKIGFVLQNFGLLYDRTLVICDGAIDPICRL